MTEPEKIKRIYELVNEIDAFMSAKNDHVGVAYLATQIVANNYFVGKVILEKGLTVPSEETRKMVQFVTNEQSKIVHAFDRKFGLK